MKYVVEHDLASHVKRAGAHFMEQLDSVLADFAIVREARGRGLLIALELEQDIARDITLSCLQHGLLINSVQPNALRFMPPLIITNEEIDEAITILRTVLSSY